jgi:hypothetical protein
VSRCGGMKVWAGPEYIPTSVVESKGEEKKKENIKYSLTGLKSDP